MKVEWLPWYSVVTIKGEKSSHLRGTGTGGKEIDLYMTFLGWEGTREALRSLVEAMDKEERRENETPTA
jgi:hypothetical protein